MSDDHWNQRFISHRDKSFYGCVNKEGEWFDSSEYFTTAVHWCAMAHNQWNLTSEEELRWLDTEGQKHGCSVIHSSLLGQLFKKGIVT